jgi:acyl-CoA thioesterase
MLLDVTAAEIVRHAEPAPDVPGPGECVPLDMGVTGREIRVVDGAYTDDPGAPAGPPTIDCWVRFHSLPEDAALHAGLLAQFSGHMSIATALRPHQGIGQSEAHRTLSMGVNAINLSFHRMVHADEWLLYHHHSTFAGDGMTHSECRVYTERGELTASFTVDAMVRPFPQGDPARDERRAL